jgi:hypothetical protein
MPRPTRLSVPLDTRRAAARGSSEPRSVNAQDERRGDCPRRDRGEDPRIRHQHTLALLLALAAMDSKRSQKAVDHERNRQHHRLCIRGREHVDRTEALPSSPATALWRAPRYPLLERHRR